LANPYINKKKIRNWKRQIRRVYQWKNSHYNLDLNNLLVNKRTYTKIWIDPWYRLTRRNPPVWLCKLMFECMCEIYDNWKSQLEALDEPYYLKIWLYDPHFINSQIVVAIKEDIDYYENVFNKTKDIKQFPLQKYDPQGKINNFKWKQFLDEDFIFKKFNELTEPEIKEYSKKAHLIEEVSFDNGKYTDTCFRIRNGDVWVGSRGE